MRPAPTRVLLLHGLWMVGLTMRRFARGLAAAGFEPVERDHLYRTVLRPEAYPRSTSGCSLDTGRG